MTFNKNFFFPLFAIILMSFVQCKKVDQLTMFKLNYDASYTISSNSLIDIPFDFLTPDITTNSQEEFQLNNTNSDLIEEIILEALTLSITSPQGEDFSMLKSIEVFINAEGLSELKVAQRLDIPDDIGSNLVLETMENDIKEYIKKENFILRVKTTTDELFTEDVQINIQSRFHVDAKILGV